MSNKINIYTSVLYAAKKWRLSKLVYDSENVVHVSCVLRPNTNSLYSTC